MQNIGAIRKIDLPDGFSAGTQSRGAIGNSWRLQFHPVAYNQDQVEITAYQRGQPLSAEESSAFRQLLRKGEANLIADQTADREASRKILTALGDALGNVANNQFVNEAKGLRGPGFYLTSMAVRDLKGVMVLQVTGRFHRATMELAPIPAPDDAAAAIADGTVYYQGIFMDGSSWHRPCQIEELLLQADTYKLYLEYRPLFEAAVQSIAWQER